MGLNNKLAKEALWDETADNLSFNFLGTCRKSQHLLVGMVNLYQDWVLTLTIDIPDQAGLF